MGIRSFLQRQPRHFYVLQILLVLVLGWYQACSPMASINKSTSNSEGVPNPFLKQCRVSKNQFTASPTRKLTAREVANILRQAFGSKVFAAVASSVAQLPKENTADQFDTLQNSVSQVHADAMFAIGEALADTLATDNSDFLDLESCTKAVDEKPCLGDFYTRIGGSLFRRPLSEGRKLEFLKLYDQLKTELSKLEAAGAVITSMILSPEFYYLIETHGVEIQPGVQQLDAYELATRLALTFTGSGPDEALLAGAKSGALLLDEEIYKQAIRLIESPAGQAHINDFFTQKYHLDDLPALTYSDGFLEGQSLKGLDGQLVEETEDYINHHVFVESGTFSDLMTSPVSFVRHDELASVYGITKSTRSDGQVTFSEPHRRGLLSKAALLISSGDDTNPFHRGKVTYEEFLCGTILRPDPNLIPDAFEELPNELEFSQRHILEKQTSKASCVGCHQSINPFGFAFEEFDSLGRFRTLEKHFDKDSKLLASFPIDSRTEPIVDGKSHSVDGAAQLGVVISKSQTAQMCFAKKWLRFSLARYENNKTDECHIEGMAALLNKKGQGIKSMLLSVSQTTPFRLRVNPDYAVSGGE